MSETLLGSRLNVRSELGAPTNTRYSSLPTADLSIRKLAAVEALSRTEKVDPALLSSITIDPNLWPTSAGIDWHDILKAVPAIRNRDARLREAASRRADESPLTGERVPVDKVVAAVAADAAVAARVNMLHTGTTARLARMLPPGMAVGTAV